ncbi:MAG: sulfatase-like hydrolase/transferase [Clostridiales bacterium]|nr:sulfatase-like hydrolase/transferase [Clostridiales bacterium]
MAVRNKKERQHRTPEQTNRLPKPVASLLHLLRRCGSKLYREQRLWRSRLIFWLSPFAALFMVEIMNEKNPFTNLNFIELLMNMIWYVIFLFVLWLIFGRRRRAATMYMVVIFLIGMVNHFVLLYRGRILFPQDVTSWQTAANVAGEYDLSPDIYVWGALAILVVWMALIRFVMIPQPKREYFTRKSVLLGMVTASAAYVIAFFFTPWLPTVGIEAQQWKTQSNGFVLNFSLALRYSRVQQPDDYSEETLTELVTDLTEDEEASGGMTLYSASYIASQYDEATQDEDTVPDELITVTTDEDGTQPVNIICIMDESFGDLAIFDTLEINEDSIPFYHSLTENTIKGWMYSPVTGAGTANVEYEFLTGNSVSFLPDETTAYQLYVRDNMPSLVSWADALGFSTTTIHPYLSSGWNRVQVYNYFGVDTQLWNTDFLNPKYIRGYISDQSDFEMIESITEAADGESTFIFNVTMQNHGGYRQGWSNLSQEVYLTGSMFGSSDYTEQYLNLMRETDNQLQSLIEYYSEVDEPTMIVLFGDHQGKLSSWFYEYKLYGKDLDERTLEELELMYVAPFFIWTNYDSEEAQDVMLSTNYLGVLAALVSNYPTTGYMDFLSDVYAELPVVQTIGYINSDGLLTDEETDLTEEQQELLSEYETLSYYNLFGYKKQRIDSIDETFFR